MATIPLFMSHNATSTGFPLRRMQIALRCLHKLSFQTSPKSADYDLTKTLGSRKCEHTVDTHTTASCRGLDKYLVELELR